MAASNFYKARGKADQNNMQGGYKNVVYFAPSDSVTLATPAVRSVPGTDLTISDDHTFTIEDDGFISLFCKQHSVTGTAASTGDDGAKSIEHTYQFVILGDDASTLDQMQDLLNDQCIWLFKDANCIDATALVQLGDECLQPTADISFDGKTTKDGLKEYTVKLMVKSKKFFYAGTVTEKP